MVLAPGRCHKCRLLITISTSGDFQRKWHANRVAASELERTAYDFLENKNTNAVQKYFSDIGDILHKRNLAIVGNVDRISPVMFGVVLQS